MHPEMDHREICQMLVRAELAGGLDIAMVVAGPGKKPRAASAKAKH
jgi:hypothetical protein